MRSLGLIGFGSALGLLSLACSGGNPGTCDAGGAGSVVTGEGASGGGPIGGAGGAPEYPPLELPACLKTLIASCPTTGDCTLVGTSAGPTREIRFASGVHAALEGEIVSSSGTRVLRVTRADDSPCYSLETRLVFGEQYIYTWKDAAGQIVATGTNDMSVITTIVCASGGETTTCNMTTPACCNINDFGNVSCSYLPTSCAAGTCR